MDRLRGIFIFIQFMITVSITIILMYVFKKNNRKVRIIWSAIQMKLMGVKLDIVGEIDNNADMMIMNHQSIMDIIVFEYLIPRDTAWVAKQEIADIPWLGRILKAPDMIKLQRDSKSSLVKLMKDTKDRLDKNRPVAIFPEGTRSDGKRLLPFKVGTKLIANKYKLKVQPFVLIGTLEKFDSKKFIQRSGTIKLICLPTIQADKKTTWFEDTENLMRKTLNKELETWKS